VLRAAGATLIVAEIHVNIRVRADIDALFFTLVKLKYIKVFGSPEPFFQKGLWKNPNTN